MSVTDKLYQFVDFLGRVLIFIAEVKLSHLNLDKFFSFFQVWAVSIIIRNEYPYLYSYL